MNDVGAGPATAANEDDRSHQESREPVETADLALEGTPRATATGRGLLGCRERHVDDLPAESFGGESGATRTRISGKVARRQQEQAGHREPVILGAAQTAQRRSVTATRFVPNAFVAVMWATYERPRTSWARPRRIRTASRAYPVSERRSTSRERPETVGPIWLPGERRNRAPVFGRAIDRETVAARSTMTVVQASAKGPTVLSRRLRLPTSVNAGGTGSSVVGGSYGGGWGCGAGGGRRRGRRRRRGWRRRRRRRRAVDDGERRRRARVPDLVRGPVDEDPPAHVPLVGPCREVVCVHRRLRRARVRASRRAGGQLIPEDRPVPRDDDVHLTAEDRGREVVGRPRKRDRSGVRDGRSGTGDVFMTVACATGAAATVRTNAPAATAKRLMVEVWSASCRVSPPGRRIGAVRQPQRGRQAGPSLRPDQRLHGSSRRSRCPRVAFERAVEHDLENVLQPSSSRR